METIQIFVALETGSVNHCISIERIYYAAVKERAMTSIYHMGSKWSQSYNKWNFEKVEIRIHMCMYLLVIIKMNIRKKLKKNCLLMVGRIRMKVRYLWEEIKIFFPFLGHYIFLFIY